MESPPTAELRADIAVQCVHAYVAAFKSALKKFPQARSYQNVRLQYIRARAIRITLEGDAEEARMNESCLLVRLTREEALLPAEARAVLL